MSRETNSQAGRSEQECGRRILLLGPTGCGKSRRLRELLAAAIVGGRPSLPFSPAAGADHHPAGERCLLIVPTSSYRDHTRNAVLRESSRPAASGASVCTFRDLLNRLAPERGGVSAAQRELIVRRLLAELDLPEFERVAQFAGFRASLADAAEEIRRAGLDPGRLEGALAAMPLWAHRSAFARFFRAYDAALTAAGDEDRARLAAALDAIRQGTLAVSTLLVDGFTDFTFEQQSLLDALIEKAGETHVALLLGAGQPPTPAPLEASPPAALAGQEAGATINRTPRDLFYQAERSRSRLKSKGFEEVWLEGNHRAQFPALKAVEAGLREGRAEAPPPLFAGGSALALTAASDRQDECELIAREIIRLVREEDYRYRDIAIIVRQPGAYLDALRGIFRRLGIPLRAFFRDSIADTAAGRHLRLCLGLFVPGSRPNSLIEWLKSPYSTAPSRFGIERFEYHAIERFAAAADGKWGAVLRPDDRMMLVVRQVTAFDAGARAPKSLRLWAEWALEVWEQLSRDPEIDDHQPPERVAELRLEAAALRRIPAFLSEIAAAGASDCGLRTPTPARKQRRAGDPGLADCGFQSATQREDATPSSVWEAPPSSAQSASTSLQSAIRNPQSAIPFEDFREFVLSLLAGEQAPVRDRRLDAVNLMNPFEARQWELRAVFVPGLVEKEFPASGAEALFLRDEDRQRIRTATDRWLPTTAERARDERLLFYVAATRARERLYLSYPQADASGSELPASFFLRDLAPLLRSTACVRRWRRRSEVVLPRESAATVPEVAALVHAEFSRWPERPELRFAAALYEALRNRDVRLTERAARALRPHPPVLQLDAALELLRARAVRFSASQLRSFARCPFGYFVERTLRLAGPPAPKEIDFLLEGNIVHGAIQEWERGKREVEITAVLDQVFDAELEDAGIPPGYESARVHEQMRAALARFAEAEQSRGGTYLTNLDPAFAELRFGSADGPQLQVALTDGTLITIPGRFDRVEFAVAAGRKLGLLVDYKYSKTEFNDEKLAEIEQGQDLQIPIYLLALEHLFGLVAAGAELYPLKVEDGARNGVYDAALAGELFRGTPPAKARLLPTDEFRGLMARGETWIQRHAASIRNGQIAVMAESDKYCKECKFLDLCRVGTWQSRQEVHETTQAAG